MTRELTKIKINRYILPIFIILFLVVYVGMLLKIFLPRKIQNTSTASYLAKIMLPNRQTEGKIAGISINTKEERNDLLESTILIPRNFIKNVRESLSF